MPQFDFLSLPFSNPVAIFLLVLLIILVGNVVFKKLKIPSIVGLIISGMLVGPHCLNLLERDASFEIFGQVGLLFLMFLAAAEIDTYHLRQNFKRGIIFGLITFIVPMALGVVSSYFAFGCSITTCILISTIYASHTLVSYPLISRFGLQNERSVVIAVCGTIVCVMLALLGLAEVVSISKHGEFSIGRLIYLLFIMAVYCVVVGYSFPWITRKFFRRNSDPVAQFIFILMLVFVSSLLAQMIGLEAILGAFYAGLILNRFIPVRSALMRHLQFAGNSIFIPYFLIGVGMLINVRVVFAGWGVGWVAINMTIMAVATKWISAFIAQKINGMTSLDRNMMFGLTSGKAAATIAATMIGFQHGLMNEDMMNGAVVMILGCCIVASLTTEHASLKMRKKLTEEELREDNGTGIDHYARQLVAVSNPLTSEGLMQLTILMRYPANTEPVTALYVRSDNSVTRLNTGRSALQSAYNVCYEAGIKTDIVERFDLNIVAGVSNVVRQKGITDIILGLQRRSNITDIFHGQMIDQLLKSTAKMIIMSRCFISVETARKMYVYAPANAELETGFQPWVERVSNLASATGCHVTFITYRQTQQMLQTTLQERGYAFRYSFRSLDTWEDFIIASGDVADDDLLIIVSARRGSLSWGNDLEQIPIYLGRNFKRHNIIVIYPEQFGGHLGDLADKLPITT